MHGNAVLLGTFPRGKPDNFLLGERGEWIREGCAEAGGLPGVGCVGLCAVLLCGWQVGPCQPLGCKQMQARSTSLCAGGMPDHVVFLFLPILLTKKPRLGQIDCKPAGSIVVKMTGPHMANSVVRIPDPAAWCACVHAHNPERRNGEGMAV